MFSWYNCSIILLCLHCRLYNHVQKASKLPSGCDYSLFKVSLQLLTLSYSYSISICIIHFSASSLTFLYIVFRFLALPSRKLQICTYKYMYIGKSKDLDLFCDLWTNNGVVCGVQSSLEHICMITLNYKINTSYIYRFEVV